MSDIVSPAKRSAMMSGIRAKDTKPELRVRKALFAAGFRYRLHIKKMPGCPDIVLSKYRAAIFVHGCFWHQHAGCKLSKIPASRVEFWKAKLEGNSARDSRAVRDILSLGWRVLIVWECHLRAQRDMSTLQKELSEWINGGPEFSQLEST